MPGIKDMVIGLPVIGFIFWVFAAPLPQVRIERTCEPINWLGNLTTSLTILSSDKHVGTAVKWSDKLNYSCQYMVWRLLYQDDYNKAVAAGLVRPQQSEATSQPPQEAVLPEVKVTATRQPPDDAPTPASAAPEAAKQ